VGEGEGVGVSAGVGAGAGATAGVGVRTRCSTGDVVPLWCRFLVRDVGRHLPVLREGEVQ